MKTGNLSAPCTRVTQSATRAVVSRRVATVFMQASATHHLSASKSHGHSSPWDAFKAKPSVVSHEAIIEVTAAQLLERVDAHVKAKAKTKQLLIMFTAEWCGPCTLVKKQLTKLAALRAPGTLTILSADVDDSKELATALGISSLPTLVFVGQDASKPSICTVGPVSARLIADVLDTKMHICGADLKTRLRLS